MCQNSLRACLKNLQGPGVLSIARKGRALTLGLAPISGQPLRVGTTLWRAVSLTVWHIQRSFSSAVRGLFALRRLGLGVELSLLLFVMGAPRTASAFTTIDRDQLWSCFTNAFLFTSGGRATLRTQEGGNSQMSFWQEAETIEIFEDATNVLGASQVSMVNQLCQSFTSQWGTDWTWNTFNDDLMWASMAFDRAYILTGNTTYRTYAKNAFDFAFSRGWDTTNGGLYQQGSSGGKCTCGNAPGSVAAYFLYQTLNDTNYLTKAQTIYNWMLANVFDPSTGAVEQGPGSQVYFTYDSGNFATISLWLGYTNYAYKAGDWVTNHWGVHMQSFGPGSDGGGMNGIGLRGLARTGHNIPFLQAACDAAWSWRNVRGLTATHWDQRTPDTNQVYCYDTGSQVAGMMCVPPTVPPTMPVTAADVVGSQVTFTAAFPSGMAYQWQRISHGVTSNIPGATNTTLTLSNLQLTNTASYQLQASNASGVSVSLQSSLTVSSVSPAVNNVIISYANQTGLGEGFGLNPTWVVAPGSVIYGQSPSSTNGNFDLENSWGDRNVKSLSGGCSLAIAPFSLVPLSLTAGNNLAISPGGSPTTTSTNLVTCGNSGSAGSLVIYTLTNSSAGGYNLTNITVYGAWRDWGRDQQAYTVYYSKVTAPTTFILLGSVNYDPSNPADMPSATRSTLTPATGWLATNVAAVKFDFTSPSGVYCGYSEIALYGIPVSPVVATNTLPVTAADVEGSQVAFTAAFTCANPMTYQWQAISGGTTNIIPGATNRTLTLSNLQLSNTASYQLQASNVYGVALSAPGSLTVSSVPAPVNNVIADCASQTGFGPPDAIGGTFTPTWAVTTNNSLIAGQPPSGSSGIFAMELPGRNVNSLTANGSEALTLVMGPSGFTTSSNYVTCGNGNGAGQSVTYTLTGSVSGYNLTNIMVYGGWGDAGRDQQAYTVYYSTTAAPTTFFQLRSVNFNPPNPSNVLSATRVMLVPATGALASNVAAVKFDFTTPASENGYCGYWGIELFGVPTPQPVKWAVGSGNWDTTSLNWKLLGGGSAAQYIENNLVAFDDSASGSSPITVTLSADRSPSVISNNSSKNYILAGDFAITSGSLIKNGSGTLVLSAANTYAGNTTVGAGTLALAGSGGINASALIMLSNGATLDVTGRADQTLTLNSGKSLKGGGLVNGNLTAQPGSTFNPGDAIGTLTVQGSVVLNGLLVMEVNRTNGPAADELVSATGTIAGGGLLTVVNLGQDLQAGDTFQLFNQPVSGFTTVTLPLVGPGYGWVNNLANNGTVAVVSTASPNLMSQVTEGNLLTLAWPSDHAGWRLQVQTDSPGQGLGTNWVDVAGSTITNQMTFLVDSTEGSVFYRLTY
jgi:autotransporter-associated beta strand protein